MQNRYVFILIATLLLVDAVAINFAVFFLQIFSLAKQNDFGFYIDSILLINISLFKNFINLIAFIQK